MFEPGNTYVNKLRATSGAKDALALRIRLERALAGASLHPSGLPPSAILCVRKLRDPLPGGLRVEGGSLQAPPAWERAVAESLDQLARRAARPALGYVPLNSEAVLFIDRPEFLACLASDWLEGTAATRWWWRSVFGAMDATSALVRAWIEALEYAPVALGRLASGGKAAAFVGSLGEFGSRLLLSGITRRFALQALAAALEAVLLQSKAHMPEEPGVTLERQERKAALAVQDPPWRRWVKETGEQEFSIAQESLLVVGLMLVRAPAVVRSRSFAEALVRWHGKEAGSATHDEPDPAAAAANEIEGSGDHRDVSTATQDFVKLEERDERAPTSRALDSSLPAHSHRASTRPELSSAITGRSDERERSPALETKTSLTKPSAPVEPLNMQQDDSPAHGFEASSESLLVASPSPGEGTAFELPIETQIETEFGGVFYLINAGLFLNLYGDFTTPAQPGIDLAIWDFVALAGRALSGSRIEGDAVWKLLAQLSGRREDEPPGQAFEPPDCWRLPGEWLAAFPEECIWRWEVTDDPLNTSLVDLRRGGRDARAPRLRAPRLRVWHPEGFLAVDVPLEDDPEEQLMRETRDYRQIAGFEFRSERSAAESQTSKLERWLGWLMPYLRARLARALGLRELESKTGHVGAALRGRPSPQPQQGAATEGRPYKSLPGVLLEHHARVVVTSTHLDVFFSLEKHPIEIRLAGLDRDAGWVPAAGRYITFHYQ